MNFNHVFFGVVFFFLATGCHKVPCVDHYYPPLKAARVQGAADSLRFNISYYTTRCERFGGFEDRDSSGIHVIYLKSLSTGCDCSDTLHMAQEPYAFKTPAAGTYYYKWGPFDGAIDTIVIN